MEKVMKEITKDIVCECLLFLGKVILACGIIGVFAYVGYQFWYARTFTDEERQTIEDVRRRMDEKPSERRFSGISNGVEYVRGTPLVRNLEKLKSERRVFTNKPSVVKPVDPNLHFVKCYWDIRKAYLSENKFVTINYEELEMGIIAKTIYLEACGEGREGMKAVASVIYNRMKERGLRGRAVCLEKNQFSCWNNRKKDFTSIRIEVDREFLYCAELALDIVTWKFSPTLSANHYFNPSKCRPKWGGRMRCVKFIGRHKFGRV